MGRCEGVGKNRCPRRPGEVEALGALRGIAAGLLYVLLIACFTTQGTIAAPDLVLTDLWDSPHRLGGICGGRATILFICDIQYSVCREGAVFFDARADEIEARGRRAVLVLIGEPAEARAFALETGIDQPVFVDSKRHVFETLLDREVLPALVLLDGDGRLVRSLYGGGESLEGNIAILLDDGNAKSRKWWLVLIPIAVVAILPLVLG
jgi:hypothetical protein